MHCLTSFKIVPRYELGKGKIWVAIERKTNRIVAKHKRREIVCKQATQIYANTHKGCRVLID